MYTLGASLLIVLAIPFTAFHVLNTIGKACAESVIDWIDAGIHRRPLPPGEQR